MHSLLSTESAFSHRFTLIFGRDIPAHNTGNEAAGYVTDGLLNDFLKDFVDIELECYSLAHFEGVWKGTAEDSFSITVCGDDTDKALFDSLKYIAVNYKGIFYQDSVMVTIEPIYATFI